MTALRVVDPRSSNLRSQRTSIPSRTSRQMRTSRIRAISNVLRQSRAFALSRTSGLWCHSSRTSCL
eukprot:4167499-Pleurochrysis_carterae.AAC.1